MQLRVWLVLGLPLSNVAWQNGYQCTTFLHPLSSKLLLVQMTSVKHYVHHALVSTIIMLVTLDSEHTLGKSCTCVPNELSSNFKGAAVKMATGQKSMMSCKARCIWAALLQDIPCYSSFKGNARYESAVLWCQMSYSHAGVHPHCANVS